MAYDELDNRDLYYDETDMFEDDSLYEPSDTFGEQIGESGENNMAEEGVEANASQVEDAFGETINHESNPHLADQLEDEALGEEATADYHGSNTKE